MQMLQQGMGQMVRPALQQQLPRVKQPPAGAMLCSIHQRVRGPNNVEPLQGTDQWRCKVGSECKLPEDHGAKHDGPVPPGNVVCSLHGKQRGPNNVEPTYPGSNQWKCRAGSICKIPAVQQQKDGLGLGGDQQQHPCSLHGKMRGPNNVEPIFPGSNQWKCKPGSECKLSASSQAAIPGQPAPIHPPEPMTCWVHGKKRSPNQLQQVNTPIGAQWECLPQFKCKGSAGAPAPAHNPIQTAGAGTAGGAGYPMPLTGMDQLSNAYVHQAMFMQHGMGLNATSMQLANQLGNHRQ